MSLLAYSVVFAFNVVLGFVLAIWNAVGIVFSTDMTVVMVMSTLSLLALRIQAIPRPSLNMRFEWRNMTPTRMHIFYAGIVLFLFAVILLTFLPGGTVITTTIAVLFTSSAPPTGAQVLQGMLFVLGIIFMLLDFPTRASLRAMRARR